MTIDRAEASIGLPPRVLRIPRTTAVDRRSNSIHPGGPTSSSADFSVPRQRFVLRSGFPLITLILLGLPKCPLFSFSARGGVWRDGKRSWRAPP